MTTAFLGLGSNLGDRVSNIREAIDRLGRSGEIRVLRISSLYETAPVGFAEQPDFINAVAEIETSVQPLDLLHAILDIEKEMGRVRNIRWGPRVIDIDLLIYDEISIDLPELVLPHPRMGERAFVLAPLAEIAPNQRIGDGTTASEGLQRIEDQRVRRCAETIECRFSDMK